MSWNYIEVKKKVICLILIINELPHNFCVQMTTRRTVILILPDLHDFSVAHAHQRYYPFTLRVPQESIVCYFHTFENNLEIKQILTKYLKESCW